MRCRALALVGLLASPAWAEDYDCVIEPAAMVRVGSAVGGVLAGVSVERGDLVSAGEEIARLRSEIEEAQLAIAEVEAASTADIEAQQARLTLAEQRRDRTATLVERQIAPQDDLDEAEAAVEVASRELMIAHLRQELAALDRDRIAAQLAQRVILSPIDGLVVERNLFAGEFVASDAAIVTIARLDLLNVEAFLPTDAFGSVAEGARVEVRPDQPPGAVIEGEVVVVDRVFDAASRTFGIRARIANDDYAIPAGQRCTVRLLPGDG